MLIEKLADGRTLMDKRGLKDYLLDFLLDSAGEELIGDDQPNNISIALAALDDSDRSDAITAMVDSLFLENGNPHSGFDAVFGSVLGMKLERSGRFFYATEINALPAELSLVENGDG